MDEDRAELESLRRAVHDRLRWDAECGAFGAEPAPPRAPPEPAPPPAPPPARAASSTDASAAPPAPAASSPRPAAPAARPAPPAAAPAPFVRRPADERAKLLAELSAEVKVCTSCRLHEGRTNTVFGVGGPEARLCFVGEGPGRDEDLRGEPFVGRAGQLLDKMIRGMGLSRDAVYICNVVKCRPPENRTPLPDETATCSPFLDRQLEVIVPEAIVALGACAARQLLSSTLPMGRMRGRFHEWRGIPVMPTYHPAYLLRNEEAKRPVWEDLQQVMARLGLKRPTR